MGLQYYDILLAVGANKEISAQGRYIYYYNGTTPHITDGTVLATAGAQRIKVRPGGTGNEILLMPGQSFKLDPADKEPGTWRIENYGATETITGQIMIGTGEFNDANTLNTIKLDATFANSVTVVNSTAARVPTTADITQTIPVSIAGNVNVTTGGAVAYTNAFTSAAQTNATAVEVLAAASNTAGVDVKRVRHSGGSNLTGTVALIAATSAPAGLTTAGNQVIWSAGYVTENPDSVQGDAIRVPTGKGLWFIGDVSETALKSVLYSIL